MLIKARERSPLVEDIIRTSYMPLISVPGSSIAGLLREWLGTSCDDRVLAYLTPKINHMT